MVTITQGGANVLKVFELEPRRKHLTIFEWFDALQPGESFVIHNDHDPIPLFYELRAERPDALGGFDYLEKGPLDWKVRITKSASAANKATTTSTPKTNGNSTGNTGKTLIVTELEPRMKHPTIFQWFTALNAGESMTIVNDHDPKPLYYQMLGELGPIFSWEYQEQGPENWKVKITKNQPREETVGQIAAKDLRKAEALKRLGIDFCCGGKKTVKQAAAEAGLPVEAVEKALQEAHGPGLAQQLAFDKWELDFLSEYIYNQHHRYYYDNREEIHAIASKVAAKHGSHYPELHTLLSLVEKLFSELNIHFHKEEKVLFPYIKELAVYKKTGQRPSTGLALNQGPIEMMEMEHEAAGEILREMRNVANNFTVPANACNSFRLLYMKLQDLEGDLHQHIHLENNILFPKALETYYELRNTSK